MSKCGAGGVRLTMMKLFNQSIPPLISMCSIRWSIFTYWNMSKWQHPWLSAKKEISRLALPTTQWGVSIYSSDLSDNISPELSSLEGIKKSKIIYFPDTHRHWTPGRAKWDHVEQQEGYTGPSFRAMWWPILGEQTHKDRYTEMGYEHSKASPKEYWSSSEVVKCPETWDDADKLGDIEDTGHNELHWVIETHGAGK